jgi:hypothetical protein
VDALFHFRVKAVKHEMASQGVSTIQIFKTQLSAGNIMAGVFWDTEGSIHVGFIPHGVIINVQCYSNWLHQMIWKKSPGKLLKKINLLHDSTFPPENSLKVTLATVVWEIMNHLHYSPVVPPCGFHEGEQKIQTDNELK